MVLAPAGLAPAVPGMAAAFQDVPNAGLLVRMLLTLPALSGAVAAPFAGLLADRWGRRPVIVAAFLLYGLAGGPGFLFGSPARVPGHWVSGGGAAWRPGAGLVPPVSRRLPRRP